MREETFQLLIETLSKTTNLLSQKSLIIGHSKLENKIDFIYSSQLLDSLRTSEGHSVSKKEIAQFFKEQAKVLRSGDFTRFIDALVAFVELGVSRQTSFQQIIIEEKEEIEDTSVSSEKLESSLESSSSITESLPIEKEEERQ